MKKKPITPTVHGLIDYAYATALYVAPGLIGCNKKTISLFRGLAIEVFLYGAITRQPVALFPLIPLRVHKLIDVANLSGMALLTGYQGVRKNRKALVFNLGMVALGITSVLLTQWRKKDRK